MTREEIDRAKAGLHIEQVVGRYVSLKRLGRNWTGCCPFHEDHTPSLVVYPATNTFHCFGCGESGDVLAFVQKMEGCSFTEALEQLGCRIAIPVTYAKSGTAGHHGHSMTARPAGKGSAGTVRATAADGRQSAAHSAAAVKQPRSPKPLPSMASEPWEPTPELAAVYASFGVRLAPPEGIDGRRALGGRVLFPLRGEQGRLLGYAGRRTCDDGSPKYINPANDGRFVKSRFLYGMDRAGEAARQLHHLFLVEGYKDVLAMHAAGFTETAGLCGTALGEGHVELISRYTHRVVLLLDGDEAGRNGSRKAADLLLRCGLDVQQLPLPEGEDPDSVARSRGLDGLNRLVRLLRVQARPKMEQQLLHRIRLSVRRLQLEGSEERRRKLLRILQLCIHRLSVCSYQIGRPATMDCHW